MRKALVWGLCVGLGLFSWLMYTLYDEVTHVNEPRITQRHVDRVKSQFGELIAADAQDLRVVWVELDLGTTVFQYHSNTSLNQLLKHAAPDWKPKKVEGAYAEIIGSERWLRFGQIWRLKDRVVISLASHESLLTDPDWQAKIRTHASLP